MRFYSIAQMMLERCTKTDCMGSNQKAQYLFDTATEFIHRNTGNVIDPNYKVDSAPYMNELFADSNENTELKLSIFLKTLDDYMVNNTSIRLRKNKENENLDRFLLSLRKYVEIFRKRGYTTTCLGHFAQYKDSSTALVVNSSSEEPYQKKIFVLMSGAINLGLNDFFICNNMEVFLLEMDLPHVKTVIVKSGCTFFDIPTELLKDSNNGEILRITLNDTLRFVCLDNGVDDYLYNLSPAEILVTKEWL